PGFLENELLRLELEGNKFQLLSKLMQVLPAVCDSVLNDTKIMEELKGFDLLLYDFLGVCGALIGDRLGIPRIQVVPKPNNPLDHMVPTPLSYIPIMILPAGFTDKMTFLQRVANVVAYIGMRLLKDIIFARPMAALKLRYNITTERSYQETVDGTELVLIRADFAIEYAQPLLPGNIMVGPLSVKEGKPLPPDLEDFVTNAGGDGFIIVSFGSNLASILPRTVVDMLATAFGKLKQRVVWRLKGYIPSFLGSNIKVVEWLPQNDLLAHKN
ncbi:2-hydroxyacylsphingosine 1-beta-galactosyltransferase-like, partial [Stylophora pistillata]|uniref:2-hydroxyacylsphingosine 1-beta-galactosyltransferase-like n=1 Tax=Stylophora pistillata TaxID=50429 RepID=UPI000C044539